MDFVYEIKDYIENFDNKNIDIVFLLSTGRSGSNLIMSFLDSHEEVLLIPTKIYYYFDWKSIEKFIGNPEQLAVNLIYNSSFALHWFTENLGKNRNETFILPKEKIASLLSEVLKSLNKISRKNVFLALHFVYAKIFGYNFSKIKTIVQHHHFFISSFGYYLVNDKLSVDYSNDLPLFKMALEDFPAMKIISTVRNPFDNYCSSLKSVKDKSGFLDLNLFYYNLYGLLLSSYSSILEKQILGERLKFIRYEDIHLHTEKTINELADFLNISHSESLFKSTIAGKLWWGNNPANVINGTDPALINDKWKEKLDEQSKTLCSKLFNKISSYFCYEKNEYYGESPENFIKDEFESYIVSHFRELNDIISFSDIYLSLRSSLLKFYLNYSEEIKKDKFLLEMDKAVNYRGIPFFIRKFIPVSYKAPDNGYFITIQDWKYYSLPVYLVDIMNEKADKIWVTSSYTRDGFIFSGILPEKIEVIHTGVDISVYNPDVSREILKTGKSFKFLFNGSFYNNDVIELLITAYTEEFSENDDVCLILRNSDIDDIVRNNASNGLNNFQPHINRHNQIYMYIQELKRKSKIPEILFFDKITLEKIDEEVAALCCSCNCLVYPYKTESTGKNILEAMACGLPVITTFGGTSSDFCNPENSYLIKSAWRKHNSEIVQNIKLVNKIHYFEPDKEHLKTMMRYVLKHQNEVKKKGINASETVRNNFTWKHTFQRIDKSIESLEKIKK